MTSTARQGGVFAALLALLWALVGVGAANPAAAHTELTSSTPANGAALATAPSSVRLVFNEAVKPVAGGIGLKSSTGEAVETGAPKVTGSTVVVPIDSTLAAGGYLLSYRVVSADGHTVKGTVVFRVRG
jgi:methionine-rich copper-binding protein CopC